MTHHSIVDPGGFSKLCAMEWKKRGTDVFVIRQNFWSCAPWAPKFQLVWKFFTNFSHCSLILNSGVFWEFQQFQKKQSAAGSHKITTTLLEFFTVRLQENSNDWDMHQWLQRHRQICYKPLKIHHECIWLLSAAGEENHLLFWMQKFWRLHIEDPSLNLQFPVQLSHNWLVNLTLINKIFFSSIRRASFWSKSTELSGTYELISILFAVV